MAARPGADLADLVLRGAGIPDSAVEERRLLASLDSVATIVYTSGTTAAPKGALVTHGNFVGQVLNVAAAYTGVVREGGNTIIFLPMAHVLARGLQLICLANGMRIAHLSDPRDVVPALGVPDATMRQRVTGAALFGFFTYATWALTGLAVLRGFPAIVAVTDIAWGVAACSAVTWLTATLLRRQLARTAATT